MEYNDYFQVGIVVKAQGVRGEVRVLPTTDDPERFKLLKTVAVSLNGGEYTEYEIQNSRLQPPMVIIKFAEVNDRNAAETLTGGKLLIPPSLALPLEENEYYLRDLIGLAVLTEDGETLGELTDVLSTGANDVYTVNKPGQKEILIPAIKQCILSVDLPGKKMTVRLPEGLRYTASRHKQSPICRKPIGGKRVRPKPLHR